MKVFFRRIHLYLSLLAGLVILTCCLTGAILVFEKDLQMAFNKDRYYVPQGEVRLPLEYLAQKVKEAFAGNTINSVKVYKDPSRSVEFNIAPVSKNDAKEPGKSEKEKGRNTQAKGKEGSGRQPGFTIFVNPYSGQVLEKYSYRETFFYKVFALHRWLLGSEKGIGKQIVGVSTFMFLFILLTGIVLWFPKTKKILAQRLKIKWNAGWKRVNHDLHLVFGFYSAIFLFIFAFTGLAWSFEWFNKGIYTVTNSSLKQPELPKSVPADSTAKTISLDAALAVTQKVFQNSAFYNIALPKGKTDAITISALPVNAVHESATDAVYIDQYSGATLGQLPYGERSLGARVRSTFKPVHTGSIWGWPSKIIALLVCLMGVTFPITGVIMWRNRVQKKGAKKLNLQSKQPASLQA